MCHYSVTLDFTGEFEFGLIIPYGDLSRLGRNYLEVGNLAEVFLPAHGCKLVSLSEPLDDMMVFRNWFNELYSKSTSKKVRAAKRISAEFGKYLGPYAPYGYQKDANNRHRLVPDEAVAPAVRRIFEMRAGGMGFRAITGQLNKDGIMPPKEYYYQSRGRKNPFISGGLWNESSVKLILSNAAYVGDVVQGKFGTVSYKDSRIVRKPAEDWIVAEGRHEALIDRDLWDRVQALRQRAYKPRRRKEGVQSLFGGLLYCADCGANMRVLTESGKKRDGGEYKYIAYICGEYGRRGRLACAAHTIYEKALTELIKRHIGERAVCNQPRINAAVEAARQEGWGHYRNSYEKELEARKKQVFKLDMLIQSLYEDKVAGIVSEGFFQRQTEKYEEERQRNLEAAEALECRLNVDFTAQTQTDLGSPLENLDAAVLMQIIERIEIGVAQEGEDGRFRDIKVSYTFHFS